MALRIAGVTLPNNKRIEIALTYVFGVGKHTAHLVLEATGVDKNIRVKDITEDEANKVRTELEKRFRLEGDLKRDILSNIKRLKEINSYRGSRHTKRLPVRGQRTKTNARTARGRKRQTVGSGRKDKNLKT